MQNSHCLLDLVELNDLWSKKICQPRWLFDLVPHSSLDDLVLFWLSKLIKAGKARRGDFWRGCVNLYLLGSHQSSLCKIIGNHHENSRGIGLRNLKMSTTSPTRHTLVSILFFISLSYISNITWTMKHIQCTRLYVRRSLCHLLIKRLASYIWRRSPTPARTHLDGLLLVFSVKVQT